MILYVDLCCEGKSIDEQYETQQITATQLGGGTVTFPRVGDASTSGLHKFVRIDSVCVKYQTGSRYKVFPIHKLGGLGTFCVPAGEGVTIRFIIGEDEVRATERSEKGVQDIHNCIAMVKEADIQYFDEVDF